MEEYSLVIGFLGGLVFLNYPAWPEQIAESIQIPLLRRVYGGNQLCRWLIKSDIAHVSLPHFVSIIF